jgi:hypothetical protein
MAISNLEGKAEENHTKAEGEVWQKRCCKSWWNAAGTGAYGSPAQKLHQFLSSMPTAQRYGVLVKITWIFVTFGEW